LISSDKSCRQLFSDPDKKTASKNQTKINHITTGTPDEIIGMVSSKVRGAGLRRVIGGTGVMSLVAEAAIDESDNEDETGGVECMVKFDRRLRKFSKDCDSLLGDGGNKNDVSCFLDLLKGGEALEESQNAAVENSTAIT